jgi:hypothetical protein
MKLHHSPGRRLAALAPVALAATAAALFLGGTTGPAPGAAGDRYHAGEPATERIALAGADETRVRAAGARLATALGLPVGHGGTVARVVDRFAGTVLDELVTTGARGDRLAIVRVDRAGRLATAVRLGWVAAPDGSLDSPGAVQRAGRLAVAAGLPAAGAPAVGRTADDGWRVSWARSEGGVPVLGDGTTITLFADGSFHAAARRERALAARPASAIDRAAAERAAAGHLAALLGAASDQARLVGARLAWVAPNDTFDGSRPDAPDVALRLAWVVEARTRSPLADRLRALELYLDAGDGSLLGGDLLR